MMADNKKNQEALEALHRFQDAQAATSSVSNTDWKAASKSADSFIETATAAADNVRNEYTKQVDGNYINSFLTDSRKHLNGALSAKTRMGVGTSKSIYESRKKESDDLRNRSYVISRYLDDHKDDLDEETYKSLKDYLDTFDKASSQSIHAFYRNDKFYSQFSTKEEYDKYVTQKEEYEKAVNLDLDAAEKEIADLEAQRDDFYWNHEYDATNHRERVAFDEALKEWDTKIAQKKQYLNQASRIQESAKLSSVADPFSGSYDHNFKDLSKYSSTIQDSHAWWSNGTGDAQYEWINNQNGFRDSYEKDMDALNEVAAATSQSSFYVAPTESAYRKKGYDHLTKDEIAIYNYYYAKEGKEKAQEYLDNIQETLNYRKATAMYGELEDNTAQELIFGVNAGLDQFSSGVRNLFNTEDNYIPQSAVQMTSGMVREDLADAGAKLPDWMGGASLGQVGYDAITTTANMAPSILTSMAVGMLNPVAGQVAGHALMGMSAAGGAYQEALNEGYDKNQARGYGLLVGASEIVMEKVLGGISALGGNALGKTLTSNLGNADTALKMIAKKLGGSMLSEFSEEYLQEVLTPIFQNLMLGTDNEVKLFSAEALYSGILGALTAGIMEGPTAIAGEVKVNNTGKQLQQADISAQRLADIGKTFSADTVAFKLAGKVDENTGAYTMGRLFNEIGATLTEQNKTDIAKALVAEGMSVDIAKRHAEIMSDIFEGGEVSDVQMKMIEKNDVLSKVMKEVLIDENSTVNQRTIGYSNTLKALANEMSGVDTSRTEQTTPGQENQAKSDKVVTENKQATQSQYEASADGKTIIKSTGETVGIKEVATIKDGQMTLKLTDGRTVDAKDVSYASESEALVYEAVANMGVNPAAANVLVNAYHPDSGVSAGVYALGIKEAYRYGQYSYPVQELAKGPFSSMLTEYQRNTAYKLGKMFGGKQVAKAQATVEKSSQVANKNATVAKKVGKVHFDGDRNALTERQSASLSALETVADILGVQIHVFESKVGENGKRIGANGWYDPKDSSIHIDLHSGVSGAATMLYTTAHELTHFIKQWSPAKFKTLANFLMKEYGQKGVSVDVLVHKQIDKAKRSGRTISYDVAYEEVIADSMETMLADGNVMEKLAKLKQQDKSLWQKIKDFIGDLAAKIRSVYEGLTPDSQEGRYVAEMVDSIEKLQELFTEGLVDASENYQASLTPGEEGVVANQNGEPVAHATADGTVQLSMRTYEESGRTELRKYLQKCVSSNKLTQEEMQEMMDGIEEIYGICKEFKDKYAPFSSWSDAAVVRDTYGKPVFSVVTPNGDYKMNLDFSLVCKKRRTLDAVFNEMSRRGIIDDFELGQKSVVKINEIIRKYELETACALCFVDAKRFRQASMADQFTNLYNELVLSLVPEGQRSSIEHFNFGGYATIKKVEGGIHTWNASKLDFSHLDEVMKNYGKGTVEHKAAKYIKAHPEGRKLLLRGDFMSSQGFDAVKTQNKDILKLYNSKKGTGGPKAAFGDVQYMNEIVKKARTWTPAKAYAVGGVRIQSFSDYVPRMVFDYTQMIYDLAATKLPAHAYTKEALFVKQFGLTGVKINMSLIPAIAEGGIAPGLDANGDYVWAGESFDYETAKEIQNAEGYTENCGTICVGVSKQHIEKLLRDPNIRMVIPYHKSGLNPIVAHMNKIAEFTDYTNDQRTKGKDGKALEKDFDFSKALHDMGDKANPKAVADQYLKWCAANGYTAKFAEFAMEENYYKLLEDFTLYDKDGNYVPQREVRAVFPKAESAFGSMKKLIKEGLEEDAVIEGKRDNRLSAIVDEIQRTIPKTEAEISEDQVAQADRDLEAEVKLPDRDYSYDSLVSKPDMAVTSVDGAIPNNRADVVALAKKNAAKVGKVDPKTGSISVHVDDINADVVLSTDGLKHGLRRTKNPKNDANYIVTVKAGEIIKNSIKINEANPKKDSATGAYVLIGVASNTSGDMYIVRSIVNQYKNELASMDVLYAINAKKELAALYAPRSAAKPLSVTSSTISIAELLDHVNQYFPDILPEDVLKHYGYDARPEGDFGENVLYSERDTESVSNRSLLANALESVAKNDIERKRLQEYKEKITLINAEEENLRALNKQLRIEKDPENIRMLQFEANQTANRINTYDRQLLRLEASRPLQDVLTREKKMAFDRGVQKGKDALEAYRVRAEKQQQETIERYQESRKRGVENRQKTAMRQKIRKTIRDLDKILNRGDKKRNVKEDMKDFVADALFTAEILFTDNYSNEDMVRNGVGTDLTPEEAKFMNEARAIMDELANLPTGYDGWLARQDQEFKLKGKLNYRMGKLRDVFVRERARLNKTQVSEVLGNLADSYGRLQNSEYSHVQGAYHESVHEYLKMLQEDVGGTIIKDMTLGQLEELYKAYTMVKTTVHNANRMFAENLNNTREALANRVMFEVHEAGGEHGLWSKAADKLNSFSWNNEKPVYAFERIGSKTLSTLYGNIRKGQDGWAVDIQEANDFRMKMYQKYKHNTWDTKKTYKFTSSSGIDFELNTDQIMSLYAYSKRAQAHDHLLKGGFVFDGNTEVVVNKKGLKMTYLNKTATAYNLSFEILENIISKLTPEQKAFVDDMQDYLSTTMGEKGNEVSMELYGVKLFNEQFYFPLRSAGQYMERAKEADLKKEQGQVNIANSGFSKAVKIKASNPVVLAGFMEVWAGHVNEMSMYHSFVLPMEDFRRVYNYSSPHMEGQPSASVNGVIQNAYGAAATDYIDQLYRDLNGGALTDNRTGPINKLMGLFKKGAVFASASVTIQQPSAVARATALVDLKYFEGYGTATLPKMGVEFATQSLHDFTGAKNDTAHDREWAELKKYAPVAVIKEMGFFDTNMGRSATDFLTSEEYSGIKEKTEALVKDESYRDEFLSKAPALADEVAWCAIWRAVKRETKARNPKMNVKSEEFLKLAGERFSEVIDKTQVYDSVLARSANMRSKDTGMKMATAFMAEPTTSINMVADALRKGKKGNKKQAARIVGSVVSSVILNSFLVAWVYAARDDDEDETYREKYLSSFISGIKDGVNPMTYIPFLKDIVSIVQGYDIERSDMAVISDLWNAYKQLERDDVSVLRKVEGFAGSICQIFGLPAKNIMRDVRSLFQAYNTIFHGEKNTTRGTAYAIMEGITGDKPSNPEQLYSARVRGDEKHAARVEGRYAKGAEDEEEAAKSANAAVRKAITDRYMDGKLTLAQATMQLTQYAGMKPDEAYWLMDGWKHKKETGSDDYNKYNAFYEAVKTGKDLKAVIKVYTDNGVKNTTLSGQITSHFKDEYVQMSAAERANIKGYLLNAYEQCGVSRKTAEEKLREWDFEAKYGGSYDEIVTDYKNGAISEDTMRSILADKGYSKSDIEDKISDWNVYKIYGYDYSELDDAYRAGELSREEFRQAMIDNGTFPAKADQAIITYDWMRDHAEYGLEYSDAGKYAHPIENYGKSLADVGLDPDIYLEYKELKKGCKGVDADNDGTADSGTLRTAKFEMIDSLPITNDQKDALAAIDYGMKSIKRYAPWH